MDLLLQSADSSSYQLLMLACLINQAGLWEKKDRPFHLGNQPLWSNLYAKRNSIKFKIWNVLLHVYSFTVGKINVPKEEALCKCQN